MTSEIKDILENMTTAAPEMEDYIGEDGLLYCGKCHTPKEAYFPEGKELFGRDRHPAECDCQRAAREQKNDGDGSDRVQKRFHGAPREVKMILPVYPFLRQKTRAEKTVAMPCGISYDGKTAKSL